MRTSLAQLNRYVCPLCGSRLAHDRVGRRFVRHLERPIVEGIPTTPSGYCPLDRGGKDPVGAGWSAGVVTEFNYRLSGRTDAQIFVGVATRSRHDGQRLAERLRAMGYETADLSGNEMAKLHVRYMVGGRTPHVSSERVCRFEFPERPGALLQFLDALGGRWNISLFYYRNHGADFGRVLAGFEVPPGKGSAFEAFLSGLGYELHLEEDNDAYRRFLGHQPSGIGS